MVTTRDVPARKRPEGERPARLTIEYYEPGEEGIVLRARIAALKRKLPVREWVLEAMREKLERDGG